MKRNSEEYREVKREGIAAFEIGKPIDTNPYNQEEERIQWGAWVEGWSDAEFREMTNWNRKDWSW